VTSSIHGLAQLQVLARREELPAVPQQGQADLQHSLAHPREPGQHFTRGSIVEGLSTPRFRKTSAWRTDPRTGTPAESIEGLRRCIAYRQETLPKSIWDIAWKAQLRLTSRFRKLVARGKAKPKVATAIARELTGFIWAIAREVPPPA
jgi:hypothetical protein